MIVILRINETIEGRAGVRQSISAFLSKVLSKNPVKCIKTAQF